MQGKLVCTHWDEWDQAAPSSHSPMGMPASPALTTAGTLHRMPSNVALLPPVNVAA